MTIAKGSSEDVGADRRKSTRAAGASDSEKLAAS